MHRQNSVFDEELRVLCVCMCLYYAGNHDTDYLLSSFVSFSGNQHSLKLLMTCLGL